MAKKRILILGAGLAGLSAAWHLKRNGLECQVFEKESEVGGLCRSKHIRGFTFDYDGHLLHFKHRYTFNLIKGLLADNLTEHKRNSWIYSFGTYTRYPFQANLYGLPSSIIKECLMGFIKASQDGHPSRPANFLEWINFTFGKGIARHFMVPYNQKFWTIHPKKLTCQWLDGFIPVPSLNQVLEGTLEQSQRLLGYNARFWYPKTGGINQLALAFARQIKNISTGCSITQIDLKHKRIELASGAKERFDLLISTLPLPELSLLIKGLPRPIQSSFNKLNYNSIFNLNLGINQTDSLKRHWIYFPGKDTCFFRVGFPHQFSLDLTPKDKSSLYVEVAYSRHKPIDKNQVLVDIIRDLKKVGLLSQEKDIIVYDINDIKYAYPIYDSHYQKATQTILRFLTHNHIISCGRYGSWRYLSMEDVILDGKDVARNIFSII